MLYCYPYKPVTPLPSNKVIFFVDVDEEDDDIERWELRVYLGDGFRNNNLVLGGIEVRRNVETMKRHWVRMLV
jgi:hypothetical protein